MDSPAGTKGTARLPLCAYVNNVQQQASPSGFTRRQLLRQDRSASPLGDSTKQSAVTQQTSSDPPEICVTTTMQRNSGSASSFQSMLRSHLASNQLLRNHKTASNKAARHGHTHKSHASTKRPSSVSSSSSASSSFAVASPYSVSELSIRVGAQRIRRRTVVFNDTPLASLESSPRHHKKSLHPYQRPAKRLISVYGPLPSPPASSSSPCVEANAFTELRRAGAQSSHEIETRLPLEIKPIEVRSLERDLEADESSDDDLEEEQVQALLLSQKQLAYCSPKPQSPPTPPSSSSPIKASSNEQSQVLSTGLRSILKRKSGVTVPALAQDADEGSRLNGRRKHDLNFDECFKEQPVLKSSCARDAQDNGDVSAAAGASGADSTTSRRNSTKATTASKVTANDRMTSAGTLRPSGNGGDDGEGRRDKNDENLGKGALSINQRIVYSIKDDDPVHFESPLRTLRGSLHSSSDRSIRQRPASRGGREPTASAESGAPGMGALRLPIMLADVEEAYQRLTRAIVRLPGDFENEEHTLQPLRQYRSILVECLERDIANISSFPSWHHVQAGPTSTLSTPATDLSPQPGHHGKMSSGAVLSEEDMRRLKDEIGTAQVAIKVVAALCRDKRCSSILQDADIHTLVNAITSIPRTPNLTATASKDIYPFVAWFISTQRLPPATVTTLMPEILSTLETTLHANDKARNSFSESAVAISHLLTTHPAEVLLASSRWFRAVARALWDTSKRATLVRAKAIATLATTARMMVLDIDSDLWRDKSAAIKDEMSLTLSKICADSDLVFDAESDLAVRTNVHELQRLVKAGLRASPQSINEARAFSTMNLLSALPVLLGGRFRILEGRGIRPFVELFTLFNEQPSRHLRASSSLIWNHVVMAFCQTRVDGSLWVFKPEAKPTAQRPMPGVSPINLLRSVFKHRRANWQPQQLSPGRREKHRLSEVALAHNLIDLVTGLTWAAYQSLDIVESTAAATARIEKLFDRIFADVVLTELPRVIKSPYEGSPALGWALLAKLLSPRGPRDGERKVENLVNPVLLDAPAFAAAASSTTAVITSSNASVSPQFELICQRAFEASTQPQDAIAFGETWTFARIEEILTLFRSCLASFITGETPVDRRLLEEWVLPVWRNIMKCIAVHEKALETARQPQLVVRWLANLLTETSQPQGNSAGGSQASATSPVVLAQALAAVTLEVLGPCIVNVRMGPAIETGSPSLWCFLLVAVLESCSSAEKLSELEAQWFGQAIRQAFAMPVETEDRHKMLLLVTAKLVSSAAMLRRCLNLGVETAEHWAETMSREDYELSLEALGVIVRLLRLHPRSSEWRNLGSQLCRAVFDPSRPKSSVLQAAFRDQTSSESLSDARSLFSLFLNSSNGSDAGTISSLLEAVSGYFDALVRNSGTHFLAEAKSLLDATPSAHSDAVFAIILEHLPQVTEPTSAGLCNVVPLLTPVIELCNASAEQSQIDAHVKRFPAFVKFWERTFANATNLDIPDELVEVIATLKMVTTHEFGMDVADTQTQMSQFIGSRHRGEEHESQSVEASVEPPRPGQSVRTEPEPAPILPSTAPIISSGRYEADVSVSGVDLSTNTTDHIPVGEAGRLSSSLHGTRAAVSSTVEKNHEAVDNDIEKESQTTLEIEETPREIENQRARASFVESLALASNGVAREDGDDSTSAGGAIISPELGLDDSSQRSAAPITADLVGDEDDCDMNDESIVIVSSWSQSDSSSVREPEVEKNARSKRLLSSVSSSQSSAISEGGRRTKKARVNKDSATAAQVGSSQQQTQERLKRGAKRPATAHTFELEIDLSQKRQKRTSSPPPPFQSTSKAGSRSRQASPALEPSSSSVSADSVTGGQGSSQDSPPNSPGTEEAIRRFAMVPVERVMRTAKRLGSPSLNRFIELGEQAKRYLEGLAGTNQRRPLR